MRRIQIYDTTLRDGSQGEGITFSLLDKLQIARKLDDFGFDYIEGGYPLSNDKDREFFASLGEKPLRTSKAAAFGMTRRRGMTAADDPGMKALIDANTPAVTIVGKTSEFHVNEVLRVSTDENLAMISESIQFVVDSGREAVYDAEHFFDGWKFNPKYAAKTIQAAKEAGASIIVLCDTNGGSMPNEVAELTRAAEKAVGIPIGIHCHNDCELAIANSIASVESGAIQVQGTINGFGERCGNADLISVIANLAVKKSGFDVLSKESVERLAELSRYVYETANMHYRNGQPFVGPSAFAHKGGMHVHAVNRVASSYEHITPESVGNQRRVLISELSGGANIESKLPEHLKNDRDLKAKILSKIVTLENEGYQFEAAEASFDILVRKTAETFKPHFEHVKYHVEVSSDSTGQIVTEATIKLKIDDEIRHEVGDGDGPVDAIDHALRKALNGRFPTLNEMHLVDYKVRVVNSEAGTAARIRVIIESQDRKDVWGTVGVSENIIEASWMALIDAVEYKLYKDGV